MRQGGLSPRRLDQVVIHVGALSLKESQELVRTRGTHGGQGLEATWLGRSARTWDE